MKKNAQSVEAWLEAMIAVARYYRLDFSQENVRATVNWERDSKREELLTDMARQWEWGYGWWSFPPIRLTRGDCR